MRIYLACTVRGNRDALAAARALCARLEQHGHDVLTRHLLADDVEAVESRLTEEQVFRRDLDWLASCQALVAEASGSSYGVGFEVGYVLAGAARTGQRVYLLFDRSQRTRISRMIAGAAHPACRVLPYRDVAEALALIDAHLGR